MKSLKNIVAAVKAKVVAAKESAVVSKVMTFAKKHWALLAIAGVAAVPAAASAADIFSGQQATVTSTFGDGSSVEKWFYYGEIITGVFGYIKTKSPLVFAGIAMVIIFTKVAFSVAG